jgi:hypothetical protein
MTPAPSRPDAAHSQVRAPGPEGNERLTSSTGLVLLVLLGVETLTTVVLSTYLNVHLFLGLLLVPPVTLKLASTGWRFARYYTRNEQYVLAGPRGPSYAYSRRYSSRRRSRSSEPA